MAICLAMLAPGMMLNLDLFDGSKKWFLVSLGLQPVSILGVRVRPAGGRLQYSTVASCNISEVVSRWGCNSGRKNIYYFHRSGASEQRHQFHRELLQRHAWRQKDLLSSKPWLTKFLGHYGNMLGIVVATFEATSQRRNFSSHRSAMQFFRLEAISQQYCSIEHPARQQVALRRVEFVSTLRCFVLL